MRQMSRALWFVMTWACFGAARGQSSAPCAAFSTPCDRGVYLLPPSPFVAWFLSAAHDDAAINHIADAFPSAARAAASALA